MPAVASRNSLPGFPPFLEALLTPNQPRRAWPMQPVLEVRHQGYNLRMVGRANLWISEAPPVLELAIRTHELEPDYRRATSLRREKRQDGQLTTGKIKTQRCFENQMDARGRILAQRTYPLISAFIS